MTGRLFTVFMLMMFAGDAFANNYFIPNHYRNRRNANAFSAIGWSDRKEAGLSYQTSEDKEKTAGVDSEESESTMITGHTFYRLPNNINLEAMVGKIDSEIQTLPAVSPKDTTDNLIYLANFGYEFEGPMALGLSFSRMDTNGKDGATGTKVDFDIDTLSIGYGYRLGDDTYLGAGFSQSEVKITANPDNTLHGYYLGAGKVYGDRTKPVATTEAVLIFTNEDSTQNYTLDLRGLYNHGPIQYYGEVGYETADGRLKSSGYELKAGLDYQFADFYVGPQIDYDVDETDSGTRADSTEMSYSLEAGYRVSFLEAFVRYDSSESDDKFDNATFNEEETSQSWTLNATYKF